MSKQTEALKLALEALEDAKKNHGLVYVTELCAIREALAEQPAQQRTDYAWPTLADYERDVGFQTNEAFRAAWNMARTTNKMLGFSEPQPAQDQGQSCYCPECERLSKELAALKAQQHEPVAYIRKDQLQKAAQSPILCEVTPEPRKDRLGIYTSPPAQQQESCGWRMRHNGVWAYSFTKDAWDFIYAVSPAARKAARDNAPASKPWVGLTDVEWQEIDASLNGKRDLARIFVRAIEAKLQEKNA